MSVRHAAIEILNRVFFNQVKAGEAFQEAIGDFSERDRRLLHEIVYGVLRRFYSMEADYSRFCNSKPDAVAQVALLVGTYQLRHMRIPSHAAVSETVAAVRSLQPKAASFVNAVLRRVAESDSPNKLKPYQRAELPRWLYGQWRDAFGAEQVDALSEVLKQPPMLSLALFVDRDRWMERAREHGHKPVAGELAETAVLLPAGADVSSLPGYEAGEFTVMDQAAQAAVMALHVSKEEGVIADICAAPGGKCALLAHRFPRATIVAVELSAKRIPRLRENLERLHCENVTVIQADGLRLPFRDGAIDAVMLDAPCSASGILRRHPDARFLHDGEALEKLANVQHALVDESLRVLHDGGDMVFAVCSIHPRENEQVVEALAGLKECRRLFPAETHDGFFIARIGG